MAMEEVDIVSGKAGDILSSCASCGIAEVDAIKLMTCTACKLVRYCSVACQKHHRPQHKRACKKRMAELRDDLLFAQPNDSCYGYCPICCLPLPLHPRKHVMMSCCSKIHLCWLCLRRYESGANMYILSARLGKDEHPRKQYEKG